MRALRLLIVSALAATGLSIVIAPSATAAASVGTFDQCERVAATASCSGWTGGNLISGYTEDMVVPQRVEIQVSGPGSYSFSTEYDDLSGSKHIIDFLATYNLSVPNANACQGYAASICAGTPSTFTIPTDTAARGPVAAGYNNVVSTHELPATDRKWTMWGGTITGSTISHTANTGIASINFTTTTPGASTVILVYGAHLALTGPSSNPRAWAQGASTVSGNAQLAANIGGAKTHNIKVGSATPPPPPAAFAIAKSVTPTTAAAGAPMSYTVTVTNTGGEAGSTSFTDDYNNNLTSVTTPSGCTAGSGSMTCTTGSIAPGGQRVFSYTANLPATFSGGAGTDGCTGGTYPVRNTATLANNTSATARVCVSASAQFTVSKTASPTNPTPGQTVNYTITVTNTGSAAGSTTFADDYDNRLSPSIPAGCTDNDDVLSCSTGTIAPNGGTQVFSYSAAMPTAFDGGTACPGGYQVSNKVAVAGGAEATRDVCVQAAPAFTVEKKVSDTVAQPGQVVTYTLTVTNTGTASGGTSVTDTPAAGITLGTLPAGCTTNPGGSFTCVTGSILAGGTKVFSYSATMPTSFDGDSGTGGCAPGAFPITNTAAVGASTSSKTVCVGAAADFTITKTSDPVDATPGQLVTYTIKVKNIGAASGSTTFTDDYDNDLSPSLPTSVTTGSCTQGAGQFSCTSGKVLSGATVTFTYTAQMPATFGPASGGSGCATGTYPVRNTATLASGPSALSVVCVTAAPTYTISKEADKTDALPGDVITYTITVKNTGTAAGSTTFADDYDSQLTPTAVVTSPVGGTCADSPSTLDCTTSVIPAGGQQTFTYSVTLPTTYSGATGEGDCAPGEYRIGNTATLGNQATDSVDVCVTAAPSFLVDKSVDNESPTPGAVLTYTIKVTNTGTAAGSTSFVDDYDNRLTPSVPAGCTAAGGELSCETGTILANGSQTFTYTATLPATYTGPGGGGTCAVGTYSFKNTVDLDDGPSDSVTVCVVAAPSFSITKEADDTTVTPGDTVTYKVTVANSGAASGSTSFVDDYDNRLTPTVRAGCTDDDGKLTCTTDDILSGESQTFTYTADMPASFASNASVGTCESGSFSVPNNATLAGGSVASVEVCVAAATAFTVTKTVDDGTVAAGEVVTYTITIENTGTASGSTTFTDDFDDRLSPSNAVSDPAGNTCAPTDDGGAKSFQCGTGTIEPGKTQTFTYSAAMPATFTGTSGGPGCSAGEYRVDNKVVVGSNQASVGVCVAAAPEFTVTKTADETIVAPGADVHYTIIVTNTGDASGTTTFTDDYDATATVADVPEGCTADVPGTAFSCTTGTIEAGDSQTFEYTGTVPTTFTGAPDGDACDPPAYPIVNKVTLAGDASSTATVCVSAAPDFTVSKSVDKPKAQPGDTVHYTVTVTNVGSAPGSTTVVDDYDNRLTPTVPDGCTDADGKLTCTTGELPSGDAQSFEYDAVLPLVFSGDSGVDPCEPGEYSVANTVTLGDQVAASKTVCVAAASEFTVAKSVDDTTADPGQQVTYKVTVANTGSVAGGTTFVDDYDDRLTPSVPDGCTAADGKLTCTTEVIEPGADQVITYSATVPATYTGPSGLGGCTDGNFPVANSVTLANGANAASTVCVAAAPKLTLAKAAALDVSGNGDQTITYTLTYKNDGAAEALGTAVTDPVPAGTGFVSCSPVCTTPGGVATWNVGAVAPAGGTGTLVLVVKVTSNQTCVITNTAQIQANGVAPVSSNTVTTNVTPQPDVANAKASGSSVGLSIRTSGLLDLVGPIVGGLFTNNNTLALSRASSSQNGLGGPSTSSDTLLSAKIPGNGSLVKAGVLRATSASLVTAAPAEARNTTTSEVASICLIPVAGLCTVESGTIRAVATTMANGAYAAVSTTGSAIENLRVAGTAVPVNLNQTTTIPLNKLIFGPNSYVAINERTGSAGLNGQKYVADQSVAMIHVKITGALGIQAVEIFVAQATSHSEFPKTFLCAGAKNQAVSGHAYTARFYTGPLLADLIQGYAQISPLGGAETEHIAEAVIPSTGVIVNAKVADSSTAGGVTPTTSTSRSWAEVAGDGTKPACVLSYVTNCVVKATAIRSEAVSAANAAGSLSTDAGTKFVGLSVFGIPISGTPAPNTTLALPGIGFIILNEQFCDNGATANHSCSAAGHTGLTVRAVRVVVTVANNLLNLTPGIELIVSEAHADTTFG